MYLLCELVNNSQDPTKEKLIPWKLTISLGDIHIYKDHINQVKEQLSRTPYKFPKIKKNKKLTSLKDLEDFNFSDIEVVDYNSYPSIAAKMVA